MKQTGNVCGVLTTLLRRPLATSGGRTTYYEAAGGGKPVAPRRTRTRPRGSGPARRGPCLLPPRARITAIGGNGGPWVKAPRPGGPELDHPLHLRVDQSARGLPPGRKRALRDDACPPVNDVGKPSTGEPHARIEAAGTGNGALNYRASPRPYLARAHRVDSDACAL
jgi:hypothetical protein